MHLMKECMQEQVTHRKRVNIALFEWLGMGEAISQHMPPRCTAANQLDLNCSSDIILLLAYQGCIRSCRIPKHMTEQA